MKAEEIRKSFLDYFEERGHRVVESSPLVPHDDPTILFTNAGMNQFKSVFLGAEKRDYTRAASVQRCMRVSGKHNDLENVGRTARHHTFFEMLGNFSFGDYFKAEAIEFGWDWVTRVLGIPKDRLWASVYKEDDEAFALWKKISGLPDARILRLGEKDNFWAMGETGPCGPCSEIHFDQGDTVAGGIPGSDEEGDRYLELWNLVFMQYNRDESGAMTPLPSPCVDTGAGLERIAAVTQGQFSNYHSDLFMPIIEAISERTKTKYHDDKENDVSIQVIADHIRACTFLAADGVIPGNEGRAYVFRRVMRRAIRHAHRLGRRDPLMSSLVGTVVDVMGAAYSLIAERREMIETILLREEELFNRTLDTGLSILDQEIAGIEGGKTLPGTAAFKLYDTYGFPLDLTQVICAERGLAVDQAGFDRAMNDQRERARSAHNAVFTVEDTAELEGLPPTEFLGYSDETMEATVLKVIHDDEKTARVILNRTPFYAESGGQAGDTGRLVTETAQWKVLDTQKSGAGVFVHLCHTDSGAIAEGETVRAQIECLRRSVTKANHTATHLLQAALKQVLGDHVSQAGSYVGPEKLRFDFNHFQGITPEQVEQVEALVNEAVLADTPLEVKERPIAEAKAAGFLAIFGEKYGTRVRTVGVGDFSRELCGGTHVNSTGEIRAFTITSESSIASGVRRIEALTGEAVRDYLEENLQKSVLRLERLVGEVEQLGEKILSAKGTIDQDCPEKAQTERLRGVLETVSEDPGKARGILKDALHQAERLEGVLTREKKQRAKQLNDLERTASLGNVQEYLAQKKEIAGVALVAVVVPDTPMNTLRAVGDEIKKQIGSGVVVLLSNADEKAQIVVHVSKDLTGRVKAGDLIRPIAEAVGGSGGGRPEMAQAGGKDASKVNAAVALVPSVLERLLSA